MFIYSAALTAKPGKQQRASAQIIESRAVIEGATGRETSAWMAVTGQPVGTFAISVRVDSVADLIDGQQKLGASVEYAGLADTSSEVWSAPAETYFNRVIGASGDTSTAAVISMTTARISGSYSDAVAFGHEVMEYITDAVGSPGLLLLSEAPDLGSITWVFGNDSADSAVEADQKLQDDTTYLGMYDRAQSLFLPGHARRSMAVKLH